MEKVYHSGERKIQKMVGETLAADANGRIITNTIIPGAINFLEKQPMAIVSSIDAENRVWASLLIGDFGFVRVPEPNKVLFVDSSIKSAASDIFYDNLQANGTIGTLFIELSSRRRFRLNGKTTINQEGIELNVEEAYPNCPKYIQRRIISFPDHFKKTNPKHSKGTTMNNTIHNWIENADTFFVGSMDSFNNMDVNHRGGNTGFIEILDSGKLKIPDYQGNSMYNTLGNLILNPNLGLLFIDFEKGNTLQLTGKGELLFNQNAAEDLKKTNGTGRFWLFHMEGWMLTEKHHSVDWKFLDYSPFNP